MGTDRAVTLPPLLQLALWVPWSRAHPPWGSLHLSHAALDVAALPLPCPCFWGEDCLTTGGTLGLTCCVTTDCDDWRHIFDLAQTLGLSLGENAVMSYYTAHAAANAMGATMSRDKDEDILVDGKLRTRGTWIGKDFALHCEGGGVLMWPKLKKLQLLWANIYEIAENDWNCTLSLYHTVHGKLLTYWFMSVHRGESLWNCQQLLNEYLAKQHAGQWDDDKMLKIPPVCVTEMIRWLTVLTGGLDAITPPYSYKFPRKSIIMTVDSSGSHGFGMYEHRKWGIWGSTPHSAPHLRDIVAALSVGETEDMFAGVPTQGHYMVGDDEVHWSAKDPFWAISGRYCTHSTAVEMIGIIGAVVCAQRYGRNCNVMVRNDCMSAVLAASRLRSNDSPTLNALAQILRVELRKFNTTFACIHVPGKFANRTDLSLFRDTVFCADRLSRGEILEMRTRARGIGGGSYKQVNYLRDDMRMEFSVDRLFFGEGAQNYDGAGGWEWMQPQFSNVFEPCDGLEFGDGVEFVGPDLTERAAPILKKLKLPAETPIRVGSVVDPELPYHLRCFPETMHAPGMSAIHSMRGVPGYRPVRGSGTSSAETINFPSPTVCCVNNVAPDAFPSCRVNNLRVGSLMFCYLLFSCGARFCVSLLHNSKEWRHRRFIAACFAPNSAGGAAARVISASAAAAYVEGEGSLSDGTTKCYLGLLDYFEEGLVATDMLSRVGKVELSVDSAYVCFDTYYKWLMKSEYASLIGNRHPFKTLWAMQWKGRCETGAILSFAGNFRVIYKLAQSWGDRIEEMKADLGPVALPQSRSMSLKECHTLLRELNKGMRLALVGERYKGATLRQMYNMWRAGHNAHTSRCGAPRGIDFAWRKGCKTRQVMLSDMSGWKKFNRSSQVYGVGSRRQKSDCHKSLFCIFNPDPGGEFDVEISMSATSQLNSVGDLWKPENGSRYLYGKINQPHIPMNINTYADHLRKAAIWSGKLDDPELITTKSPRKGMSYELMSKAVTPTHILFANRMCRWADRGMPGALLARYSLEHPWQWNEIFRSIPGIFSYGR